MLLHITFIRAAEEHGCSSLHHGVNLDKAKEELSKLQTINNTILSQLVKYTEQIFGIYYVVCCKRIVFGLGSKYQCLYRVFYEIMWAW